MRTERRGKLSDLSDTAQRAEVQNTRAWETQSQVALGFGGTHRILERQETVADPATGPLFLFLEDLVMSLGFITSLFLNYLCSGSPTLSTAGIYATSHFSQMSLI